MPDAHSGQPMREATRRKVQPGEPTVEETGEKFKYKGEQSWMMEACNGMTGLCWIL